MTKGKLDCNLRPIKRMTHLLALTDRGKLIAKANLSAHDLPGLQVTDAASDEAVVFIPHAPVPVLRPGLGSRAPIAGLA
jgi:hypothetical protein